MIIQSSTYFSFESSATVEPRQRISNIYIYLYVSDQSVVIGSETKTRDGYRKKNHIAIYHNTGPMYSDTYHKI